MWPAHSPQPTLPNLKPPPAEPTTVLVPVLSSNSKGKADPLTHLFSFALPRAYGQVSSREGRRAGKQTPSEGWHRQTVQQIPPRPPAP